MKGQMGRESWRQLVEQRSGENKRHSREWKRRTASLFGRGSGKQRREERVDVFPKCAQRRREAVRRMESSRDGRGSRDAPGECREDEVKKQNSAGRRRLTLAAAWRQEKPPLQ
ncbi:hypothetical protein MRX96_007884 [Rhipicephalus microplus]